MFPKDTQWLYGVHVLDLEKNGYIGPHVDSIKVKYYWYIVSTISNGLLVLRQYFIWTLFDVFVRNDFKERKDGYNRRFVIKTTHFVYYEVRYRIFYQ